MNYLIPSSLLICRFAARRILGPFYPDSGRTVSASSLEERGSRQTYVHHSDYIIHNNNRSKCFQQINGPLYLLSLSALDCRFDASLYSVYTIEYLGVLYCGRPA